MIKRLLFALNTALAVLLLSGCGAGNSAAVVPGGATKGGALTTAIVIKIPNATTTKSHVKPAFVSPSTKSITVAIAPGSGCTGCSPATTVASNLTPTSPGCGTNAGSTTCTITLALNPGSYSGNVTTYDGALSGSSPTGNALSSNQSIPFTVKVNQSNNIVMSLNGIPATVQFALTGTSSASLGGSTLTIDGAGTAVNVSAITKDADGNTIVGPGSPTVVSATVSGNQSFTAAANGSAVTITTPPKGTRTGATVTVGLNAPGCPGGPACSAQLNANMTEFVAVGEWGSNDVQIYSERTQSWIPVTTGSKPDAIAFDSKGDMFVGNSNDNTVTESAPPYTGAPVATISTGVVNPISLALDSNNNLFVANYSAGTVTEYAPPYTASPSLTISGTAAMCPYTILVDPSNDLWIANACASSSASYFPAPVSTSNVTTLFGATDCEGLTQDSAGNIDFSCISTYHVMAYTTAGAFFNSYGIGEVFNMMIPLPSGNGVGVIGSGSPGTVPIAALNITSNNFLHINSNGSTPKGVATDGQNTLFIADIGNGVVTTLPYPYTGTAQLLQSGLASPYAVTTWP